MFLFVGAFVVGEGPPPLDVVPHTGK